MKEIISTIDTIAQFGLQTDLALSDNLKILESNLIKIYALSFEVDYIFDETNYKDFDKSLTLNLHDNIKKHFPMFTSYKIVEDITDFETMEILSADAVDDLSDIIIDLLEIKWRIENNSIDDGIWYFKLIFQTHTKYHILNLLKFITTYHN